MQMSYEHFCSTNLTSLCVTEAFNQSSWSSSADGSCLIVPEMVISTTYSIIYYISVPLLQQCSISVYCVAREHGWMIEWAHGARAQGSGGSEPLCKANADIFCSKVTELRYNTQNDDKGMQND